MRIFYFLLFISIYSGACAQRDNEALLSINAQIEEAAVKKNTDLLEKYIADDFVFIHGTGFIDNKSSWIKSVANPSSKFSSRVQDSTTVELHDDVALVTGKVEITRLDKDISVGYGILYIRVYRKKKDEWQIISHRTTKMWNH